MAEPSFFYQVDRMRPRRNIPPRIDPNCRLWLPPNQPTNNVITGHGRPLYFDGNHSSFRNRRGNETIYGQPYSMYFDNGRIWIAPCNATTNEASIHWYLLRFNPCRDSASYATYAGQRERLYCQRRQQPWRKNILPHSYHTYVPDDIKEDPRCGALNGEVQILLGLIALSALEGNVDGRLQYCVKRKPWRTVEDVSKWNLNERGIVVTVWLDANTTEESMKHYEHGTDGRNFHD